MKKILLFAFSVLLGVFLIDAVLGVVLEKLNAKSYSGNESKINYLLQAEKKNLIAIGSSRINHSIMPEILSSNGFNLGVDGKFLAYTTGMIELLDQNNKLPDSLIVHIDLLKYQNSKRNSYDKSDIKSLAAYYKNSSFIKSEINKFSTFERLKYLFSSYRFNGKFFILFKNLVRKTSFKNAYPTLGFEAKKKLKTDDKRLEYIIKRNKENKRHLSEIPTLNENAKELIKKIMKIANDNNIKLFFVVAPSYNNLNSPDPAINRDLEKLLDGFPYFNYRNNNLIPELTENKSYWKDLVHFNKDGALIFTKKLKQDLGI